MDEPGMPDECTSENPDLAKHDERKLLYAETRKDLLVRQLSNSEKYDNAILTLSTAVLGVSLVFIKDIVPLNQAQNIHIISISWWFLMMSIATTLFSFVASQLGINRQLAYAEKYYLKYQDKYLTKTNWPARFTDYLNYLSGILFVISILLTVIFVSSNLPKENSSMPKKTSIYIQDGAPVPTMQKAPSITGTKGAPIPSMQPVNTQGSTQTGGNQTSNAGKK